MKQVSFILLLPQCVHQDYRRWYAKFKLVDHQARSPSKVFKISHTISSNTKTSYTEVTHIQVLITSLKYKPA